jgi:hypothetical protein
MGMMVSLPVPSLRSWHLHARGQLKQLSMIGNSNALDIKCDMKTPRSLEAPRSNKGLIIFEDLVQPLFNTCLYYVCSLILTY